MWTINFLRYTEYHEKMSIKNSYIGNKSLLLYLRYSLVRTIKNSVHKKVIIGFGAT